MMITATQANTAHKDPKECESIVNQILYDGSKPKFKMYLAKIGIPYHQLDEYEILAKEMILEYLLGKYRGRFNHDKVSFEKYMWISIMHVVFNKLKTNKIRNSRYCSSDEIMEKRESGDPPLSFGVDKISELKIDIENLFDTLTQRQGFICRCIYYSDWNEFEISDYLNISKDDYQIEILGIREKFTSYFVQ